MAAREDSLVKSSIDILKAQGPDAALQYTKNQLSSFGVTQAKVDVIEKKILDTKSVRLLPERVAARSINPRNLGLMRRFRVSRLLFCVATGIEDPRLTRSIAHA